MKVRIASVVSFFALAIGYVYADPIKEIREAAAVPVSFSQMDRDGNGTISRSEFLDARWAGGTVRLVDRVSTDAEGAEEAAAASVSTIVEQACCPDPPPTN